jgi:hypothetical protein
MFNATSNEKRKNIGNCSYLEAWEIQPGISKGSIRRKDYTSQGIRGAAPS